MLKSAVVLTLFIHAIGQIMPFLAAWTQIPVGFSGAAWVPPGNRRITDAIGKLCGLAALLSLAAFLIGTDLLWINAPGWQAWLIAGAAVSLTVELPWWHTWAQGARIGNLFMNIILLAVAIMR